jgi:spore maturation protein CgeB
MAAMGFCPSGRLFEAAACGVPLMSDSWEGLELFYTPGREILIADSTADSIAVLGLSDAELARVAAAARERTLTEHTASARALDLERLLSSARRGQCATSARTRAQEAEA